MAKQAIQETVDVGRRKTAVASVRLRPGTGKVKVNGREFSDYFKVPHQRTVATAPLIKLSYETKYDIIIREKGGGLEAQSEAIRLGIARALVREDEELRKVLKDVGYLTGDSREKERKKYGRAGARKSFQFSKR